MGVHTTLCVIGASWSFATLAFAQESSEVQAPIDPTIVTVTSDHLDTHFGLASSFGDGPHCYSYPKRESCGDFDYSGSLCIAPCTVHVHRLKSPYRIVGPKIAPSSPFMLPSGEHLNLRVHTGAWPGFVVGMVLTIMGAAWLGVGSTELIAYAALGEPPVVNHTVGVFLPIGIVSLSLGATLFAVGLPLWLLNKTRVRITQSISLEARGLSF